MTIGLGGTGGGSVSCTASTGGTTGFRAALLVGLDSGCCNDFGAAALWCWMPGVMGGALDVFSRSANFDIISFKPGNGSFPSDTAQIVAGRLRLAGDATIEISLASEPGRICSICTWSNVIVSFRLPIGVRMSLQQHVGYLLHIVPNVARARQCFVIQVAHSVYKPTQNLIMHQRLFQWINRSIAPWASREFGRQSLLRLQPVCQFQWLWVGQAMSWD